MTDEQLKKIAYLNRAYYLEKKIISFRRVKERNKTLSAVSYKSDGTQHTGGYNREECRVMKILYIDEKISDAEKKLKTIKQEIKQAIDTVDDDELRELLEYRYIGYMLIDEIATAMYCDRKTIQRKHKKALDKVVLECRI